MKINNYPKMKIFIFNRNNNKIVNSIKNENRLPY